MKLRSGTATVALVVAGLLLASCGGGGNEGKRPPTPTTTTTPATTTAPTTAPTTTVTPSTSGPTTTTTACAPVGSTAEVRVDYPAKMSSLVGKDVRTGTHPCFERFVIELQTSSSPTSSAFPGYWVRYATGPVVLSPKGEEVTIKGGAVLLVSLGSWMRNTENVGYSGPDDVFPTNVTTILEYRLTENFEGQSTWAVGIDHVRNFRVSVLSGPPRLVVDIQR